MNTYETIRSICTQTNRNFESIEPLLLDWKKSLPRSRRSYRASLPSIGKKIPLMAIGGTVVRETNTGKMGLVTNSEPCHALFAALLKRAYPDLVLPQKPALSIPAKLFLLIIKVPVTLPWEKFKKTLSYAG
ncbi:MAG TPA: hypothetical protein VJ869_06595 [Sphaerochaeta sp.]|nr:hypothetical protein [Sphaerochaeta sp.]